MGENEIKLVKEYLRLSEELKMAENNHHAEIVKAKMEGIVFCYETYTSNHWSTFEHLLEKYYYHNR